MKYERIVSVCMREFFHSHSSYYANLPSFNGLFPGTQHTYFEGELTDGDAIVWIVGFDRMQYDKLEYFYTKKHSCLRGELPK